MSSASLDDPVTVELAPDEAAGGVDKTISLLTGRLVTIRVPAGTIDGSLLRLPNADTRNPAAPRDVILRARVVATPGVPGERPTLPVRPETTSTAGRPEAAGATAGPEAAGGAAQPEVVGAGARPGATGGAASPPVSGVAPEPAASSVAVQPEAPGAAAQPGTPSVGAQPAAAGPAVQPDVAIPPDLAVPPVRPRRRRAVVVAASLVVVVLLAVVGLLYHPGSGRHVASPSAAGPPSAPAGPVAYRDLLATADARLTTAFQRVAAARTPTDLRTATRALRDTLADQVTALRAAPDHAGLVEALAALEIDADHTSAAATSLAVCGSASALPDLTGTPAAGAVRTAAQALAADGYPFGSFLPAASTAPTRQEPTGTYTRKGQRTGQGRLKITNNGTTDGVISLAPAGTRTAAFAVYVRAGATFTVSGVKDGTYQIFQATGVDWDEATGGFTRQCAFQQVDGPATFKSTGGTYTQWSTALGPAPSAAASGSQSSLSAVDPDQFPS